MTLLCTPVKGDLTEINHGTHKTLHDQEGNLRYTDSDWKLVKEGALPDIISYHDYEETPEDLEGILATLKQHPAKLYKIATQAKSSLDALRMLEFVRQHKNVIGLCMGELGQITRILAPVVGTPIMYAPLTAQTQTAPGQLEYDVLMSTYHFRELNEATAIYGLIGNPVVQSIGHEFHNRYFQETKHNAVYVKIPLHSHELGAFFDYARRLPFHGLSVTMPLKERILPFLDEIAPQAKEIGAVNTLLFKAGKIWGYNTDAAGALAALGEVNRQKIVILGRGGVAKAIAYATQKAGAAVSCFGRELQATGSYDILINATPSPMPIDPGWILPGKKVMDVGLQETPFLRAAREKGCHCIPGMAMYVHQALAQQQLWGVRPKSEPGLESDLDLQMQKDLQPSSLQGF